MVASTRSVSDFDVHEALDMCSEYFLKFGDTMLRPDFRWRKDKFDAFKEKFERIVSEKIKDHQKEPSITIDTEIKVDEINREFINFHRKLAPFGPHNMKPIFTLTDQKLSGYVKQWEKIIII